MGCSNKKKSRLKYFAENLQRKYLKIYEEVVNPGNQPMTRAEIRRRDKLKKRPPASGAKVIKGPKGRKDTPEEARYRFATYLTLRGKAPKKKKEKD